MNGSITFDDRVFELVPCPICGSRDLRLVLQMTPKDFFTDWHFEHYDLTLLSVDESTRFYIQKCKSCAFVFANPRFRRHFVDVLNNEAVAAHHDQHADYYETALSPENKDSVRKKYLYRYPLDRLFAVRPPETGMACLEYGCGLGYSLVYANMLGLDTYGIDIDRKRVSYCRRNGLRAFTEEDFEREYPAKTFDYVFAQNCIEHLVDLDRAMTFLRKISKPGTLLYLDGLSPRVIKLEKRQGGWFNVSPIDHVNYFTPKTLDRLTAQYGFRPLRPSPKVIEAPSLTRLFRSVLAFFLVNCFELDLDPHGGIYRGYRYIGS